MRKLLYISVAILTFITGTTTFYLYFSVKTKEVELVKIVNSEIDVATVRRAMYKPTADSIYTFYDATQNIELYKAQKMYIRGYLVVRKLNSNNLKFYDLFDFKEDCIQGCLVEASLQLPRKVKNKKISSLINELVDKGKDINLRDGFFYAEVEVIGKIEETTLCFAPPYYIKVEEIKQISPVKFLSLEELPEMIRRNNSSQ